MNERIKELAQQAGVPLEYSFVADSTVWNMHQSIERFAQLIIRECGQTLVDNTPVTELVEDWDRGYDRAMNDCIHLIYEHFGVKE